MPNVVSQNIPLVGKNKLAKKLDIVSSLPQFNKSCLYTTRQDNQKDKYKKNISIIKTLL